MAYSHEPVLLEEVARLLSGCQRVLDCTVGGGGHAARLLSQGAAVLALDKDPAAVQAATVSLSRFGDRARVLKMDFSEAPDCPDVRAFRPDAVLLDLGVSSPQLDDPGRGFSFRRGTRLDMRMEGSEGIEGRQVTAAWWLNHASESELADGFHRYADERHARKLAREIARRRATAPFRVSDQLVAATRAVLGPGSGPADFARIFQAVRIVVNDELGRLERALPALFGLMEPSGVIAVIAYHSGEDRIVKHQFREWGRRCVCPPPQPVCNCRGRALGTVITRRPVTASQEEAERNPRSRSAHLRAFRKTA